MYYIMSISISESIRKPNIKGIYTGDKDWAPNKIEISDGDEEIDGEYDYFDRGGGGIIFLNQDKNTILKVKEYIPYENTNIDKEVYYQEKLGDISPDILYHDYRTIDSNVDGLAFDGNSLQVIIMEYLNPDEWIPLHDNSELFENINELFHVIYDIVYIKGLFNPYDFIGNTGPHLFFNDITGKIKVIDYGSYKESTNNKRDFLIMVKDIQDFLIKHPTDIQEKCYQNILDDKEINDICKEGSVLYLGYIFLSNKIKQKKNKYNKNTQKLGESKKSIYKRGGSLKKTKRKKKKRRNKKRTKKRK